MTRAVTAIFDIGKTNKKFFLFDDDLVEVFHTYEKLPRKSDDDGDPCDDLAAIGDWIKRMVEDVMANGDYALRAINFSTYGATLVHLDAEGNVVTPLYDYLKPFPEDLKIAYQEAYGTAENDRRTASPFLGMLNAGLQLYWLKYRKPEVFAKIRYTLHFPQYLSYLFTRKPVTEPTSIGCHTKLWDFEKERYATWVEQEGMLPLMPETVPTGQTYRVNLHGTMIDVGVGIHDSSSALAAYLTRDREPFLLISTGTWSITLNPFTADQLTPAELQRDCLSYLTIDGRPVKSSRLFLGNELDHQLNKLNVLFGKDANHYRDVPVNENFLTAVREGTTSCKFYPETLHNALLTSDVFGARSWNPSDFPSFDEAYHHLIWGLVLLQVASVRLALGRSAISKIYIDGGFISNELFVRLLRQYLPDFELVISSMPLGSAYGAAAVIRSRLHATVSPGPGQV